MDQYTDVAYLQSQQLTQRYSTSFSLSSRLFSKKIRNDIYAIYGLVRIADEIVDTYQGANQAIILNHLEKMTYEALELGYSSNPLVHSFAVTARAYDIDKSLIKPFFDSMRMDLKPQTYTQSLYKKYIYGSAEVVGLMCLKVFVQGDAKQYDALAPGARALGAAYQKVNFLRDLRIDQKELKRSYFPGLAFATFNDESKKAITEEIATDFALAKEALRRLPNNAKPAVSLSYAYYHALLKKLNKTPASVIKKQRVRIGAPTKLWLFIVVGLRSKLLS